MKYVALLRGINVGGNNRVPMSDLKHCFESAGFENVSTYINSGNVLFDSPETDIAKLVSVCETAIEEQFMFPVICSVIAADDLIEAVENAPDWWNDDSGDKHNAIFVIAPKTTDELMREVGDAKPEYEKVAAYNQIIFWSAPLKTFGRTRYNKIVGTQSYKSITIRNANTTVKLAELCQ